MRIEPPQGVNSHRSDDTGPFRLVALPHVTAGFEAGIRGEHLSDRRREAHQAPGRPGVVAPSTGDTVRGNPTRPMPSGTSRPRRVGWEPLGPKVCASRRYGAGHVERRSHSVCPAAAGLSWRGCSCPTWLYQRRLVPGSLGGRAGARDHRLDRLGDAGRGRGRALVVTRPRGCYTTCRQHVSCAPRGYRPAGPPAFWGVSPLRRIRRRSFPFSTEEWPRVESR